MLSVMSCPISTTTLRLLQDSQAEISFAHVEKSALGERIKTLEKENRELRAKR